MKIITFLLISILSSFATAQTMPSENVAPVNLSTIVAIDKYSFECIVDITVGWNLVGSSYEVNVGDMAISTNLKIFSIWSYDKAKQQWKANMPALLDHGVSYVKEKGFGFLNYVQPGEGYWINSMDAGQLNLCPANDYNNPPPSPGN